MGMVRWLVAAIFLANWAGVAVAGMVPYALTGAPESGAIVGFGDHDTVYIQPGKVHLVAVAVRWFKPPTPGSDYPDHALVPERAGAGPDDHGLGPRLAVAVPVLDPSIAAAYDALAPPRAL